MSVIVTAGVIRKGGRILIARRASGGLTGRWEFPGGKIEPGETPEECMARELREELALTVDVGSLLHRQRVKTPRGPLELLFFDVRNPRGRLRLRDHDLVKWFGQKRRNTLRRPTAPPLFTPLTFRPTASTIRPRQAVTAQTATRTT